MEHLQAWLSTAPFLMALLTLLYLPGLLVLRLADVRRNLALGLAPAVTCGLVGVSGIVLDLMGVRWGWFSFLLSILAACLLVLGYRWVQRRSGQDRRPLGGDVEGVRWSAGQRAVAVSAVCVAVLLHWIPVFLTVDPAFPSALTDPMFHYNGVHAVSTTGNASMFGAMDWNHGLRVLETTYPAVWHALASLVAAPGTTVVVAHVLAYLATPVVFLVGMACLGAEAFPRRHLMTVFTPLIAAGFAAFPDYMTVGKGFWPNALALALLPGLLAVLIAVILDASRGRLAQNSVRYTGSVLVLLAGTAGMVLAHPTFIFTLLWVCAPGFVVVTYRLLRRLRRAWPLPRFIAAAVIVGALAGALLAVVFSHPQVQAAMSRPIIGEWTAFFPRLTSTLVLWSSTSNPLVLTALLLFYGSLTVVAVGISTRSRRSRWVLAAWGMQTLLILGVYFPLPVLSQISGIWYSDVYRLFAIQVVFLSLLLSMALSMSWARRRGAEQTAEEAVTWPAPLSVLRSPAGGRPARVVVGGIVIVHLALGGFLSWQAAYAPAGPATGEDASIASEEELQLLETLDERVPEGSVILGDSLSGIGYAPVLGDVESVFTQFKTRSLDEDGTYLTQHFADIHEDPQVCEILHHYGIAYYYEDDAVRYEGELRDSTHPGLYGVDTSEGFTEIASAGEATLWEIDVCGEIDPREDWWDESWRDTTVTGTAEEDEDAAVPTDGPSSQGG